MVLLSAILEMLNIGLILPLMHILLDNKGQNAGESSIFDDLGLADLLDGSASLSGIATALITVFILKNLMIIVAVYLQAKFIAELRAHFTVQLVKGYASRDYEDHLSINSAHAVHDISQTAPSVVGGILQAGMGIVMEALLASGALIALVIIDPISALIAGTFVVVALALYYAVVRRVLYDLSARSLSLSKTQSSYSHFFLGATKESRVLGRNSYFIDRINRVASALAKIIAVQSVITQLPRIYGEIVIVGAIVAVSAYIIDLRGSTESALPLLAVFAAAAFRVLPSANRITHHLSSLRQTAPLLDTIYDDLCAVGESSPTAEPPPSDELNHGMRSGLSLRDVSYRYPEAAAQTLKNINIEIGKGEAVAIVGKTGAGKSTLIDLILGLLPPSSGKILIDGNPVGRGPAFWHGRVGYVPQSIYLMDDTLRRNIALGIADPEIDEEQLKSVCQIAQLDDVLNGLPAGFDSEIGERGLRLSGGQRQRIGIARALYSDPDVLVLDEATSALDSSTERDIANAINALSGKKTLIVIAHRLSTVRLCDNLYFLQDGVVIGSGSFESLAASCPPFGDMLRATSGKPPEN